MTDRGASQRQLLWDAVAVLPNLQIGEAIESKYMALVPRTDARTIEIEKQYPNLYVFLNAFRDAFGVREAPSIILRRSDVSETFRTVDAVASFRDMVSISTVTLNRALELQYPRGHRPTWANTFWIYPWMTDKNNKYLVAQTPGFLGIHETSEFRGQSAPEIPSLKVRNTEIDAILLAALVKRWQRRFATKRPAWADRALFRSLNMAHQAALMPAGADATIHDFGRSIALWVSALEILIHPRTSAVRLSDVCDLLERVDWQSPTLRARRHKAFKSKPPRRHNLASWLCAKLYMARHDFLHGNPISERRMMVKASNLPINRFAAPVYRLALSAFLNLRWSRPMPSLERPAELGRRVAERMEFYGPQSNAERALLRAVSPPADAGDD